MSGLRAHDMVPATVILALLATILCMASPGETTETLVVDFADTLGPAVPHGTGMLGGWSDGLPDSLIALLRPRAINGGLPFPIQGICDPDSIIPPYHGLASGRTTENARVARFRPIRVHQIILPWCWIAGTQCGRTQGCSPNYKLIEAGTSDWDTLTAYLDMVVDTLTTLRDTAEIEVAVTIWSEANLCGSWPCEAQSWQFYRLWHAVRDYIKAKDATIPVLGPSFAGVMLNPSDPYWSDHQEYVCSNQDDPNYCGGPADRPTLPEFLQFCADSAGGVFPDWFDWHSFPSDYPPPHYYLNNIYAEADSIRAALDTYGAPSTTKLVVSEMMGPHQYVTPGAQVWHFAKVERAAREFNLHYACRSYWDGPSTGGYSPDPPYTVENRLGGMIEPDPAKSQTYLQPRYAWWVTRAYAEMPGWYVRVDSTTTNSFDGLASVASSDTAVVLIGKIKNDGESEPYLVEN